MNILSKSLLMFLLLFAVPLPVIGQDDLPPTVVQSKDGPELVKGLEIQTKVSYVVKGINNPRVFEYQDGTRILIVDELQKDVVFQPAGFIRIETEAANVEIEIEDIHRNPVPYEELVPGTYKVEKSGKLWIAVTAIDFEKNIYRRQKTTLTIPDAPKPDPDDGDDDDGGDDDDDDGGDDDDDGGEDDDDGGDDNDHDPDGPYDGIAYRVAQFKNKIQIDKRNQLIVMFDTAIEKMRTFEFKQFTQVSDYLASNRPESEELNKFYDMLNEDSKKRQLSWQATQTYYGEIVKGLR